MLAQIFLKQDAVVPEHHHESEQVSYVLEGALKFELEGREVVVRKGELLLHSVLCSASAWSRSKTA